MNGPRLRTSKLFMICDSFEVVAVPFPFTEMVGAKRRPALVVSKKAFNERGHTIMGMITTKDHNPWPGDTAIQDLTSAGLHTPCIVRFKIFTLDNRLIIKKIGRISKIDETNVIKQLREALH